jgi:hypothetical protein
MDIIIDNVKFPLSIGKSVLKNKYTQCPFPEFSEEWDSIIPQTFSQIASEKLSMEQRRIAISHLGIERLVDEVDPTLVSSETLHKTVQWIDEKNQSYIHNYEDTYSLFAIDVEKINPDARRFRSEGKVHYIEMKDTSTNRRYLIWVDIDSVKHTNDSKEVNPIACIAWTIMTNVPEGGIDKIVRQGDCVLVKALPDVEPTKKLRHLTEKEYRTLLVAES